MTRTTRFGMVFALAALVSLAMGTPASAQARARRSSAGAPAVGQVDGGPSGASRVARPRSDSAPRPETGSAGVPGRSLSAEQRGVLADGQGTAQPVGVAARRAQPRGVVTGPVGGPGYRPVYPYYPYRYPYGYYPYRYYGYYGAPFYAYPWFGASYWYPGYGAWSFGVSIGFSSHGHYYAPYGAYGYGYPYGYAYPYGGYPPAGFGGYGTYVLPPAPGTSNGSSAQPDDERNNREVEVSPMGSLRLRVSPRTAQVWVNGALAGEVDDFDGLSSHLDIAEGRHAIEFRADGYQPVSFDVDVAAGRTRTVRVSLKSAN